MIFSQKLLSFITYFDFSLYYNIDFNITLYTKCLPYPAGQAGFENQIALWD